MPNSRKSHKQHKSPADEKKNPACSYCARPPQPKEHFPACARCKLLPYCSRECQKKDWPEHKLYCEDTEMQCKFMYKYLNHVNADKDILPSLRLALLAEFYAKFTSTNPEPRKMWVVRAIASICPYNPYHHKELEDENIPLSSLSGKQMMGGLLFVDIFDISNTTDHPLDDRSRAIWQAYRDDMDKEGYPDAHVVLAKFNYWNQTLLMVPFAVSQKDLAFYGIGGLDNPRMLRGLNAAIQREALGEALGGKNPKKRTCLLGDNDMKQTRDWALRRKAWEAKHGRKPESCI